MYKNQQQLVLEYLEKNKTITMLESIMKLGVNHPQHAIMILRREGYPITDRWVKNPITNKRYKEYRLEVE